MSETEMERKLRLYDEGCAEHARTDPEARAYAIANCTLCNEDGYRGNRVCDHIDRTQTAKAGIAKCREALAAKQLKLDEARDA